MCLSKRIELYTKRSELLKYFDNYVNYTSINLTLKNKNKQMKTEEGNGTLLAWEDITAKCYA